MRSFYHTFIALLLIGSLGIPQLSFAQKPVSGELYYGSISDISGNTMNISYSSPSGNLLYSCTVDTLVCKQTKTPSVSQNQNEVKSSDGSWMVTISRQKDSSFVTYTLYSVKGKKKKKHSVIPYRFNVENIKFSADLKTVYLNLSPTERVEYSISQKKLSGIFAHSSSGTGVITSPNSKITAQYQNGSYIFTSSAGSATYPSTYNGSIQFSPDSKYAAVLTLSTEGTHRLALLDVSSLPRLSVISDQVNKGTTVTDYVFAGKWLYYISNDVSALQWPLVRVNPLTNDQTVIESHVAYEDNLYVSGSSLFYSKINGKVLDIYRVTDTGKTEKTKGTPVSPSLSSLERTEVTIAGSHGALIQPQGASKKSLPLIVWMHGGPRRQTSIGYHPYLSYAVYDDILEKLALEGARVWKIDYTGSWGYGNQFIYALRNRFGDVEIRDIEQSIRELTQDYPTSGVYLTGTSYGGYTALKTNAEFPSLIDGTVAINAVTDWQTLVQRIPGSPFVTEFGGMPGLVDTQPRYDKASIVQKLSQLDSDPVVVVYGSDDTTVPPWQSTEFIAQATLLNAPVSGISLPGEQHVLQKRASLDTLCTTMANTFAIDNNACSK